MIQSYALSNTSLKFSKNLIKQVKKESKIALKHNLLKSSSILLLKFTVFLCTLFSFIIFIYSIFGANAITQPAFQNLFYYLSLARNTNKTLLIFLTSIPFCSFCLLKIPLKYGTLKWFWHTLFEKRIYFSRIFFYYESLLKYFKVFLFHIILNFIKFLYLVLCLSPSIMFFIFSCIKMQTVIEFNHKVIFAFLISFSFILVFASFILYLIVTMKYIFAAQIFALNENLPIRKILKISIIAAKKNRLNIIRFFLSFSLLFISCIFILPIFFVFPYFNLAFCNYSSQLPINIEKSLQNGPLNNTIDLGISSLLRVS